MVSDVSEATSGTAKKTTNPVTIKSFLNSTIYKQWLNANPFLRFGLPLISLTILGAVGLAHLQQGRKDVEKVREDKEWEATQTTKALSREGPLGKFVKPSNKQLDLERELKTLQEKTDINNFEYKKIPRPSKLE
eukprot:TRINITY_DN18297_c0_g1_i9.p1 TRINITY_DN18297_c0_g1~~TRINITY_DN18297_c0_g1_i9.p1  ORF type:complete len:134 (-),score=33.21 TRINITY_DN18297_c0_g1_i9:205-606(-)